MAVLGLRFCARAFSSCGKWGPLFIAMRGPLLLQSTGSRRADSVVVAHGPSWSVACGIFPDRGSNPCPLHWQADSQPLHHQGSPIMWFLFFILYFLKLIYLFIYFWLCWVFVSVRGLSLVAASGGHSSSWCTGLSLLRHLLLQSTSSRRAGSVVVAHGPSCSAACGIFPDQGLNPCPLHWQADSQPLRHQGNPHKHFLLLCLPGESNLYRYEISLFISCNTFFPLNLFHPVLIQNHSSLLFYCLHGIFLSVYLLSAYIVGPFLWLPYSCFSFLFFKFFNFVCFVFPFLKKIHCDNFCLLSGMFYPSKVNIIIDMFGF